MTNQLTVVIPVSEDPGSDMYWHEWLVITVRKDGLDPKDRTSKKAVEDVVASINLSDFLYDEDDEDQDESLEDEGTRKYLGALIDALTAADYQVLYAEVGNLAFPGDR